MVHIGIQIYMIRSYLYPVSTFYNMELIRHQAKWWNVELPHKSSYEKVQLPHANDKLNNPTVSPTSMATNSEIFRRPKTLNCSRKMGWKARFRWSIWIYKWQSSLKHLICSALKASAVILQCWRKFYFLSIRIVAVCG